MPSEFLHFNWISLPWGALALWTRFSPIHWQAESLVSLGALAEIQTTAFCSRREKKSLRLGAELNLFDVRVWFVWLVWKQDQRSSQVRFMWTHNWHKKHLRALTHLVCFWGCEKGYVSMKSSGNTMNWAVFGEHLTFLQGICNRQKQVPLATDKSKCQLHLIGEIEDPPYAKCISFFKVIINLI